MLRPSACVSASENMQADRRTLLDLIQRSADAAIAESGGFKVFEGPPSSEPVATEPMRFPSAVANGITPGLTPQQTAKKEPTPPKTDLQTMVGARVTLQDLKAKPELNGTKCLVVQVNKKKGRLAVRLDGHDASEAPMLLKPENLVREE